MAVNEQIVTGRKFRKLIDEAGKLWQRISFWTKSSDVEFDDGKTAETKVGAINGITSDLSCEEPTIAASAAALNQVNRSLPSFIYDETGKIIGYKTQGGADTVFPFNNIINSITQEKITSSTGIITSSNQSSSVSMTLDKGTYLILPFIIETSNNGISQYTVGLNTNKLTINNNQCAIIAKTSSMAILEVIADTTKISCSYSSISVFGAMAKIYSISI